jgi:hypothetical protein
MSNKTTNKAKAFPSGDVVLQEVWRIKDALSASYNHDVSRLFAETRKREKRSGHPFADLPVKHGVE